MLRRSVIWFVSQKWSLCSSQVLTLLAESQQDATGRTLHAARNFLRDVDLSRVVQEPDDALELLYYMQRVEYPKQSKLEETAREWFQSHPDAFQVHHVNVLCRYVMEHVKHEGGGGSSNGSDRPSNAVELWHRVVLRSSWFRSRLPDLLQQMDLSHVLVLARVLSWARASENTGSNSGNRLLPRSKSLSEGEPHDSEMLFASIMSRCREILSTFVCATQHSMKKAVEEPKTSSSKLRSSLKKQATPDSTTSVSSQAKRQDDRTVALDYMLTSKNCVLSVSNIVDLLTFVLPRDATAAEIFPLLEPHLFELSALDTVDVIKTVVTIECGVLPQRVLSALVLRFIDASAQDLSPASIMSHGSRLLQSLAVSQEDQVSPSTSDAKLHSGQEGRHHSPLKRSIVLLCEMLVNKLTTADGEADTLEDGVLFSVAESTAKLERAWNTRLAVSDALLSKYDARASRKLLVASVLSREQMVVSALTTLSQQQKRTQTLPQAKLIVQSLAILLLNDELRDKVLGPAHLHSNLPTVAACIKVLVNDRLSLNIRDLASLLFVSASLAEGIASSTSASSSVEDLHALADTVAQRIAVSSKFLSKVPSAGSSTTSNGGSASSGSAASNKLTGWSLDIARMIILGLASCGGYDAQRQPTLIELINQAVVEECKGCNETDKMTPLTAKDIAALLVALTEIRMQQDAATKSLVKLLLVAARYASATDLVRSITALAALNIRDIHVACSLLRELEQKDGLTTLHVVQAADGARRLRLTQQYQLTGLSRRVVSFVANHPIMDAKGVANKNGEVASSTVTPAGQVNLLDLISMEHMAILLSAANHDEQRRLFQLMEAHTVHSDNDKGPKRSVLDTVLQLLPEQLPQHPAVALMFLSCKGCPMPVFLVIAEYLSKAPPIPLEHIDPSMLLDSLAMVDTLVADRNKAIPVGGGRPSSNSSSASLARKSSTIRKEGVDCVDALFADLVVYAGGAVQQLGEAQLQQLVSTALLLNDVPNKVFRVVGRRIVTLADGMTAETCLKCLDVYAKYKVRDDRVVKALLNRCIFTIAIIGASVELTAQLRRICDVYPHWSQTTVQALQRYSVIKARRERRMI